MRTLTQIPVGSPNKAKSIFVVGFNGSGTTMLSDCLGRHPDIYSFPGETGLIPFYLDKGAQHSDLEDNERFLSFWQEIAEAVPDFCRVNGGSPPPIPDDWRRTERSAAGIFDAIFRNFSESHGKAIWCEKSPQNMQHMEKIGAAYPDAKFIHIIRDGRDCAASLHRRWHRTPKLILYRWQRIVEDARSRGKAMGDRYYELRYEDLTSRPRFWMEDLVGFLGLEFSDEVLVSSRPQTDREGEQGEIEAQPARWRSYFTPDVIEDLDRIAGPLLGEIGYPRVLNTSEPEVPRKLDLFVWRLVDFLRALVIQNRRRKERNPNLNISLWVDLMTSIRNVRSNRI